MRQFDNMTLGDNKLELSIKYYTKFLKTRYRAKIFHLHMLQERNNQRHFGNQ